MEPSESAIKLSQTPEPVSATTLATSKSELMSNSSMDELRPFSKIITGTNCSTKENYVLTTQWRNISSESDDKENKCLQNAVRDRAEVEELQVKGRKTEETELQSKHMPDAMLVAAAAMAPYQSRQCLKSTICGKLQGSTGKRTRSGGRMTC